MHYTWCYAIIHGAMPLYMVICHYTWCYAIIHGDMPFFRASEILKTKCQKALSRNKAFRQSWEQVGNSSVGTASNWKTRTILTRVRVPDGARDFSPSQLSMQTLLRYSHSPRVQWHASKSVCTLKPPKHWQPYSSVWTHHNTAHTDSHIAVFGHTTILHTLTAI